MSRPKRNLSEELANQTDFVNGVLALVSKHFGRKPRKPKAKRTNGVTAGDLIEEFKRA